MGQIKFTKVLLKNLQDTNEPAKTYAVSQSRGRMSVAGLAKHMSAHNTPFTRGTIQGILNDFIDCVRELICDGWIVDLGDLGTFNVVLKSRGVCESVIDQETGKKPVFDASDITAVNLQFTPGSTFENMINDVEFIEVESIAKQTEHKVAKKTAIMNGTYAPNDKENPDTVYGVKGDAVVNGGNGAGGDDAGGDGDDMEIHE